MRDRIILNEKILAESIKDLCGKMNLATGVASNDIKEEGKKLYRQIFYKKNYNANIVKKDSLYFDINSFNKMMGCRKCTKNIFTQLNNFSQKVLNG